MSTSHRTPEDLDDDQMTPVSLESSVSRSLNLLLLSLRLQELSTGLSKVLGIGSLPRSLIAVERSAILLTMHAGRSKS